AQQRPGRRPEDVQTAVGAGARGGELPDDPIRPAPYEGKFPTVRQVGERVVEGLRPGDPRR
ncbi:hypothetical protein ACWGSA_18610, partial [Streptomyces diastaticus]